MKAVVPFRRWHYKWLMDRTAGVFMPEPVLAQLEGENSWTGVVENDPLVCAGTVQQWPGRHVAWAYLGDDTGPHMRWITREVQQNLTRVQGRIELTVRCDFPAGHRWAEMLGFKVETPRMEGFGPEGEDHTGYVRFN